MSKGCADWPNYDPDVRAPRTASGSCSGMQSPAAAPKVVRKCSKEMRHRRTYNVEEPFALLYKAVAKRMLHSLIYAIS